MAIDVGEILPMMRRTNSLCAHVAELVDALDSKSNSLWECRFDSGRGYHQKAQSSDWAFLLG